ncbi:MAG: VWA domain-containing protein, partial [Pyrinomonadaceae bacterium]
NKVERENISVTHPARFVLIGSGNPEEGELRPQLLDRFGLSVEVKTEVELDDRVEIVERREAFDRDAEAFSVAFAEQQAQLRKRITAAQKHASAIRVERTLVRRIAELCAELGIDGHRGELTITRAARALTAFEGKKRVGPSEITRVAAMALRHRLRRDPLEEAGESERIQQALEKTFPETRTTSTARSGGDGDDENQGGRPQHANQGDGSRSRNSNDKRRVASGSAPATVGGKTSSMPVDDLKDRLVRLPKILSSPRELKTEIASQSNRRTGGNSVRNHLRGRYVRAAVKRTEGSRVAVDATLRAAVSSHPAPFKTSAGRIAADSLRFKELSCKTGRLFIFAIDTSGSMALHRIKLAKIAVLKLLKQSYIRRDQVAIVGFRGESAELYLSASRSILRARRVLDSLRVGGGTPLTAGLACALKLAKDSRSKVGEVSVLLFTDGNANVALHAALTSDRRLRRQAIEKELSLLGVAFRKARITLTVVDTQDSFIRTGDAGAVAKLMGARYSLIPIEVGAAASRPS